MILFDTNVLIYFIAKIDEVKQKTADFYIKNALIQKELIVSPLVFSELVFTLYKINTSPTLAIEGINFIKQFVKNSITPEMVLEATDEALKYKRATSINDFIHISYANKYCKSLITFDKGFMHLKDSYNFEINIL